MAYNLIVTEHADSLIDSLTFYLLHNLHNPGAALHFMDGLENVYERLAENPFQFPESRDDSCGEESIVRHWFRKWTIESCFV